MVRASFLCLFILCLCLSFDRLVLASYGLDRRDKSTLYRQDTTKRNQGKDTLELDTIQVDRRTISAKDKFAHRKEEFKLIYFWGDTKDMVTLPHQGGIAVNLNKLYNKLSRKGKNARKLQRELECAYEADLILEEWVPLTQEYTSLTGDSLIKFRHYYQPSLYWLRDNGTYEKVTYIQQCLKNYLDSVDIIHKQLLLPMDHAQL